MSTSRNGLPDFPLSDHLLNVLGQLGASASEVSEAITLPPECYTSEEWFDFERRAVFDRDWVCLGHHGSIPNPGDYVLINMNDDPLLVWRGQDKQIHVMSAVCQHRGHVLGEPRGGNAMALTCPFHAWTYDDHGTLTSAPEMDGTMPFEELKKNSCLPTIRTEIWNGFIFMNMDGKAPPLAPRLKRLTEEVKNHRMTEMGATPTEHWGPNPWNWKFMQENAIEPHHTWYLHKGPHDFAPSRLASFFDWDDEDDGAVFHPTGFVELDGNFNMAFKSLFPTIETLTEKERKQVMFVTVPPNLFFGAVPDGVFYYVILPHGANSMTLRVGFLYPKKTLQLPNFPHVFKTVVDGLTLFNDQDTVANTRTHEGLKSRFANRSRYAPKEATLPQFNRWLIKRYRAYADHLLSKQQQAAE